jgi:hypothetical protein
MNVTPNPTNLVTSFITFNTATRVVAWYTNLNSRAGEYTIRVTGRIQTTTVWTKSIEFKLTVTGICYASTEVNQLVASANPNN